MSIGFYTILITLTNNLKKSKYLQDFLARYCVILSFFFFACSLPLKSMLFHFFFFYLHLKLRKITCSSFETNFHFHKHLFKQVVSYIFFLRISCFTWIYPKTIIKSIFSKWLFALMK